MSNSKALTEAKAILKPLGMTITYNQFEEYRVNFSGGKEIDAYYTNDLADAVRSGQAMALRRQAFFEAVFSNGQTEAKPLC